ncbi:MAG: hypothetical protein IKM39_01780 [Clostridia bacterium]|nr:hypothetical protein [Clostridia bacterium]
MYQAKLKRTILVFIACVTMFCVCFTMHISATTPSEPSEETSSQIISSEESSQELTFSQDESSQDASEDEDSSSEAASDESVDSAISSDETSTESITEPESSMESVVEISSIPISSGEVSSLIVEAVSEGGAPDYTYESEWNAKQSYVYEGSYAGLNSEAQNNNSQTEQEEIKTTNQSATAQKYAKYATVGMIVFGILTVGSIALLVYYNMKVKRSKKLHPEWYPKKEKVIPKHGKH